MPSPERKREGVVIRTGKRSSMERLSLVEGCSQPSAAQLGKSQENKYPHRTPLSVLLSPDGASHQAHSARR